jgi:hypothetical protein
MARAEAELEDARNAMRAAARRAGVSFDGLFGDCRFIKRETGDRWVAEAKREGAAEAVRTICRAFGGPSPDSDEIKQQASETRARMAADKKRWRALKAAGFDDAVAEKDWTRAVELYLKSLGEEYPARMAADAILAAARKRDAGGPAMPEPTGLAAKILDAAGSAGRRLEGDDLVMKQSDIASVTQRDLLRDDVPRPDTRVTRFMCGRGMKYRGSRFCSDRCRDFYAAGNPGHEQDWLRPKIIYSDRHGTPMRMGPQGFIINCAHCREGIRQSWPAVLFAEARACLPGAARESGDHGRSRRRAGGQAPMRDLCRGDLEMAQWAEGVFGDPVLFGEMSEKSRKGLRGSNGLCGRRKLQHRVERQVRLRLGQLRRQRLEPLGQRLKRVGIGRSDPLQHRVERLLRLRLG